MLDEKLEAYYKQLLKLYKKYKIHYSKLDREYHWLFFLIEQPKNAIYKQRVKAFKVYTAFNGKYMIHTAIF